MQKALFLDRDGVLNYLVSHNGELKSPFNLKDFLLIDKIETRSALQRFKDAGYLIVVVTNQPSVNAGLLTLDNLREMHQHMVDIYPEISHILTCPHIESDNCKCRKPKIGMLTTAAELYNIDLQESIMVGDSWRDEKCAKAAGVRFIKFDKDSVSTGNSLSIANSMTGVASIIFDSSSFYYTNTINEFKRILDMIDIDGVIKMTDILSNLEGRLFCIGVGGGAANASHAVNDFRKICNIESYAITDNVAELTARTNDNGWNTCFIDWLKVSRLSDKDCIFVFSVGGGSEDISQNIVEALKYAKEVDCKILGIVGRGGGYTRQLSDVCIWVPSISDKMITPYVESIQSLVTHLICNNPKLIRN